MQIVIYADTVVMDDSGGCGCEVEVQEVDTMASLREALVDRLDLLACRCYDVRNGVVTASYDAFLESLEQELSAISDEIALAGAPDAGPTPQEPEEQTMSVSDDNIIWGT